MFMLKFCYKVQDQNTIDMKIFLRCTSKKRYLDITSIESEKLRHCKLKWLFALLIYFDLTYRLLSMNYKGKLHRYTYIWQF